MFTFIFLFIFFDASNILKPALARGEIQCIGATTIDEYRKYIEKDSALERRFQPVTVNEPSKEDTLEILKGLRDKYEVHHMPADNVNGLERKDGPAIRMDKEDHRETASCGNSREAREYRAHQKELIEQGKFREALEMDIDDIRGKFGDKYDDAILEMLQYVDKLEMEGRI